MAVQLSQVEEMACSIVNETITKRRACCERWKAANKDKYLIQKRALASRPEYRAICRQRYKDQQDELRTLGIVPRKLGRPRLYSGQEALEHRRQLACSASARYRNKSLALETNDQNECETID